MTKSGYRQQQRNRTPKGRRNNTVRFGGFQTTKPTTPPKKRNNNTKSRLYNAPKTNRRTTYTNRKTPYNDKRNAKLQPIQIDKNSIHSSWKQQLGGLIRLYINKLYHDNRNTRNDAMNKLEQYYIQNNCSISATKQVILSELGVSKEQGCSLLLALEGDSGKINVTEDTYQTLQSLQLADDGKGLILPTLTKQGEGPAHAHEQWTNVIVPKFAQGKSYYLVVHNTSLLDLSCEVTIDGHLVAKNVPVPKYSNRTIRPDNDRYFERHKWVFEQARRVKIGSLNDTGSSSSHSTPAAGGTQDAQPKGKRYNNQRPHDVSKRVDLTHYPDPTTYGWTFTGSAENSSVEFFEKKLNIGIMKLDWYYTTATVKTTLDHPTLGRNALYRNTVTPELYREILVNPRVHTNCGYRDRKDRNEDVEEMEEDVEEEMNDTTKKEDLTNPEQTTYYAKNDNYDFTNEGHINRAIQMSKLQESSDYQQWQSAAKQEWSFIHAKFFLSTPEYRKRSVYIKGGGKAGDIEPEEVPEQAPIVDVKSSEKATLGTKFRVVGPNYSGQVKKSRVRMQRIDGLKDGDVRAAPVFECKLYYRSEDVLLDNDTGVDDGMMNTMETEGMEENEQHATSTSSSSSSLQLYKEEVLKKISNWHSDHPMEDVHDAVDMLTKAKSHITRASNQDEVDSALKVYWDWNQTLLWKK